MKKWSELTAIQKEEVARDVKAKQKSMVEIGGAFSPAFRWVCRIGSARTEAATPREAFGLAMKEAYAIDMESAALPWN